MILGGTVRSKSTGGSQGSIDGPPVLKHKYLRKLETQDERDAYQSSITFYDVIPDCTISLADFERYAVARLKILRIIECQNQTGSESKGSAEWENKILTTIKKQGLSEFSSVLGDFGPADKDAETQMQCRKFDHISHFLLRLAFSRTEEQRKWFISLELDFFKLKFNRICKNNKDQLSKFLTSLDFPGVEILPEERNKFANDLNVCSFGFEEKGNQAKEMDIYKIPFNYALDLVRQKKVFLHKGFAYIPYIHVIDVVAMAYRSYLSQSMSLVKKNMYQIEQDHRIIQIIEDFDRRHTGSDYLTRDANSVDITFDQLPSVSQKSFPMCMKSLYDVVVKDHHLKHWGRLQLGLFLKGIGVPLEDATKFWRTHFTKKPEIDMNRFDKQYLYNIRHMYGKEGKRADYTPYSCMKIISSSVGPGDYHGCPFKHSDAIPLRVKLTDAKIHEKGVKEIMDLVEQHHYQIACQKYFEFTHDSYTIDGGVNHPNQFFEESRDVLSGRKTLKAEERFKTKKVNIYPDGSSSQPVKLEESDNEIPGPSTDEQVMEVDDLDDDTIAKICEVEGF